MGVRITARTGVPTDILINLKQIRFGHTEDPNTSYEGLILSIWPIRRAGGSWLEVGKITLSILKLYY